MLASNLLSLTNAEGRSLHRTSPRLKIALDIAIVALSLSAGCPTLATLETAKVGSKHEAPNQFITGDAKQADLYGSVVSGISDTAGPARVGSTVPMFEGKIRWILIDERLDFTLNGGTSGLGVASKLQIINRPVFVAVKVGVSGFPRVFSTFPNGCYSLDLIASRDLSNTSEVYAGGKAISWFDLPPPIGWAPPPVDPYFDAVGGFLGLRMRSVTVECGVFRIYRELENYWGVDGYIPVVGISFPAPD